MFKISQLSYSSAKLCMGNYRPATKACLYFSPLAMIYTGQVVPEQGIYFDDHIDTLACF